MYEIIKRLYLAGQLTPKGLDNAVEKGWITREQADVLTAPAKQTDAPAEPKETSDG